jgi:integrin beta 8
MKRAVDCRHIKNWLILVFQILFRKQLSSKQWLSLILLTAGCMIKQIDFTKIGSAKIPATSAAHNSESGFQLSLNLVFIFVQVRCIVCS